MPYVDETCPLCAGYGWKQCPICSGHGVFRCLQKCDNGKIACPAGCDHGFDRVALCDYCRGTLVDDRGKRCMACNQTGHMRCGTCNQWRMGGGLFNEPGFLRCPAECNAGYLPCPCTLLHWGAGKTSCDGCVATPGVVAVWHNEPVLADLLPMPPASPDDSIADREKVAWAAAKEREEMLAADERDRLRLEQEQAVARRDQELADDRERLRRDQELADERERLRRDQELADDRERLRREQELAESERRRLEAVEQQRLADAEDERRRNEGSA